MNSLTVIPTYISDPSKQTDPNNILTNYDHATPINERGELDRCLKSLGNVENLGLVLILVVAQKGIERQACEKVREIARNNPQVSTMVVGKDEVEMLRARIDQVAGGEIAKKIVLRGYGNVRNVGLVLAQAFGFDSVLFIDDDEVIDSPDFMSVAAYGLGKLTPSGVPILAKSGYYLNDENSFLSSWKDAWYNKFWQQGGAFNSWIEGAMAGPRLTRSNHVCGGCFILHKQAFKRISFDPYIARGEDLDYMINLRMHGADIWFDNAWQLRHMPPKTKSEGRRFRQDIYRWIYEQAKIEFSWANIDLRKVTAANLMPYPGPLLGKGLKTRIALTARLRSFGRPDKREYSRAAKEAKTNAIEYATSHCTKYFDFQRAWPAMMEAIAGDRVISEQLLSMTSDFKQNELNPGITTEIQLDVG